MEESPAPVIDVQDLVVDYGRGRKSHRAVDGLTFRVMPGECVGFIGANGAGKSTTMKALLGFVFPASGSVRVFGAAAGTVESRQRLGYLPEVALYYPFMKARELLELYGGLQGMSRRQLAGRILGLLKEVGLEGRGESLLKNFSKGMQQRLGIAQAIIADPELLILDELSSGLDPLGRHDLREVILRLKTAGKTIFFSSHELTEVEALCDRVIMINKGRLVTEAPVADLMKPLNLYDVTFSCGAASVPESLHRLGATAKADGTWRVELRDQNDYANAVAQLAASGCTIVSTESRNRSLEDYFIELVREAPAQHPTAEATAR
jgi:ABC-2 type transport system ATP-binding protein